jgi:hypothetical protein
MGRASCHASKMIAYLITGNKNLAKKGQFSFVIELLVNDGKKEQSENCTSVAFV